MALPFFVKFEKMVPMPLWLICTVCNFCLKWIKRGHIGVYADHVISYLQCMDLYCIIETEIDWQ